jgi:hypothetical protein
MLFKRRPMTYEEAESSFAKLQGIICRPQKKLAKQSGAQRLESKNPIYPQATARPARLRSQGSGTSLAARSARLASEERRRTHRDLGNDPIPVASNTVLSCHIGPMHTNIAKCRSAIISIQGPRCRTFMSTTFLNKKRNAFFAAPCRIYADVTTLELRSVRLKKDDT